MHYTFVNLSTSLAMVVTDDDSGWILCVVPPNGVISMDATPLYLNVRTFSDSSWSVLRDDFEIGSGSSFITLKPDGVISEGESYVQNKGPDHGFTYAEGHLIALFLVLGILVTLVLARLYAKR